MSRLTIGIKPSPRSPRPLETSLNTTMISSSPPPDDLPENSETVDEELFSQEEIEEAYQRALAAFESAQAETDTDEFVPSEDADDAGQDEIKGAEHSLPPAGGPPEFSRNPVGAGIEFPSDSATVAYDEIPVDLTSWTDGEVEEAGTLATVEPAPTGADANPVEMQWLEEQAHAEFEALQATLPPETQAAWEAETLATVEPSPNQAKRPAAPPVAERSATPSATSRAAAANPPQPPPADLNVTPSQVIEAALFVGGQPLTAGKLYALLRGAITIEQVPELIDELNTLYAAQERPYEIRLGDGGYRLELRPEYDRLRARVFGQGPREVRLSQDLLEVLALVAYRQPITQAEIEALGKASPGNQLRQLLRRELIQLERDPDQPKEVRYRTTERFLSVFGLANLADLPQPDDLAAR